MTGGLIGISLGIYAAFGGIVTPLIFVSVGIIAVFVACYMLWRDERKKLLSANQTKANTENDLTSLRSSLEVEKGQVGKLAQELLEEKNKRIPQLIGNILWIACGRFRKDEIDFSPVTALIEIRNIGMPTVAVDWILLVGLAGEQPFYVPIMHIIDKLTLGREGMPKETILEKDVIYSKTMNPIPTGGLIRGYIHFWIQRPQEKVEAEGTILEILFKDVTGRIYSLVEDRFPTGKGDYHIPYIPGIENTLDPSKILKGSKKRNDSD